MASVSRVLQLHRQGGSPSNFVRHSRLLGTSEYLSEFHDDSPERDDLDCLVCLSRVPR